MFALVYHIILARASPAADSVLVRILTSVPFLCKADAGIL